MMKKKLSIRRILIGVLVVLLASPLYPRIAEWAIQKHEDRCVKEGWKRKDEYAATEAVGRRMELREEINDFRASLESDMALGHRIAVLRDDLNRTIGARIY